MKTPWKRGLLLVAAVVMTLFLGVVKTQTTSAANPSTVSFQGKVVNADGTNVADGTYTFIFKLYNTATSSGSTATSASCTGDTACLWAESDSVSVAAGIFQVNLGANTSLSTIDFNANSALYLGIEFNGDTAEMSPRPQMQSVPYAFNADKVGGFSASQLAQLSPSAQQTGFINVSGAINGATISGGSLSSTLVDGLGVSSTTVSGAAALTVSSGGTGALTLSSGSGNVSTGSNTINGQTISSAASFSGTLAVTTLGTGGVTSVCTNASKQLAACNANAGAVTLQQAYAASTNPEITVNSTNGAFTIRDNATAIGANLLEVQNNAGTTTYLGVSATGAAINGTLSATGTVNGATISSTSFNTAAISGGSLTTTAVDGLNVSATTVGGTGALTVSSGGTSDLSLTSGSGTINLNAATEKTTASHTFDLSSSSNTTLTVTNSGTGTASLSVEGAATLGTGLTVTSGGATITGNSSVAGTFAVQAASYTSGQVIINDGQTTAPPTYPSSYTPALTVVTSEIGGSRPLFFGYNNGAGAYASYIDAGACGSFDQMCFDLGDVGTQYTALQNVGSTLNIGGNANAGNADGNFATVNVTPGGGTTNIGGVLNSGGNINLTAASAESINGASGQNLTLQSQGAGGLILNSGSGTIGLLPNTTTVQRVTAGTTGTTYIDLKDTTAANTVLQLWNSGSGVSNLQLYGGGLCTGSAACTVGGATMRLTNAGALTNLTGIASLSGTTSLTQGATDQFKIQASAVPTFDQADISNAGFPITTDAINAEQVDYYAALSNAAYQASALRVNITNTSTVAGSTTNGLRVVTTTSASAGNTNGIKVDPITAGTGTANALSIGTGWTNVIQSPNFTVANATGSITSNGSVTGGYFSDATHATETSTATYPETSTSLGYYLSSAQASNTAAYSTTFNITGLPAVDGTIAFITISANRTGTQNHTTNLEIAGSAVLGTVVTAAANAAITHSFIVMRMGGTWRILGEPPTGTVSTTTSTTTLADYAEYIEYSGNTQPRPGDVLTTDTDSTSVQRSTLPYDTNAIGVVSTTPYQTAGADDGHSVVIALTGRVPVNINLENGPIKIGDKLTSSSTPGQAMKATKAGHIIGVALSNYDGSQAVAQVTMQLQVGYDNPTGESDAVVSPALIANAALTMDSGSGNVSLDTTAQTASLDLGTSKAASVNVGRAGQSTTINGALVVDQAAGFSGAVTMNFAGSDGLHVTSDLNGAVNGISFVGTPSAAAGTKNGVLVQQADGSGNGLDGALTIDNANKSVAINSAINITNSGGAGYTNLIKTPHFSIDGNGNVVADGAITSHGFAILDATGAQTISFDTNGNATFTGNLNLSTASLSGGLTVGGDVSIAGLSTFQKLATFIGKTIFRQDVEFDGHITVAADSAGYATLRTGETKVHVTFKTAYDNPPIASASATDGQFVSIAVSNVTAQGFDISLQAPATQNTNFSWTAVGVNQPQTASNPLPPTVPPVSATAAATAPATTSSAAATKTN